MCEKFRALEMKSNDPWSRPWPAGGDAEMEAEEQRRVKEGLRSPDRKIRAQTRRRMRQIKPGDAGMNRSPRNPVLLAPVPNRKPGTQRP